MANFEKSGRNVNGEIVTGVLGQVYELGLWGPLDTRTTPPTELDVSISPRGQGVTVQRGEMVAARNVRVWKLGGLPLGRTVVEARDRGGLVWTSVTIEMRQAGGTKYTNNPNEVVTQTTTPNPRDVVAMVLQGWTALTDTGARTLTAQFVHETGSGKYCFNWNLGNVKAGPNEPHMYLRNVWELDTPAGAQAAVARSNGLARVATPEEARKRGWGCPAGKAVVVFEPPHPQCRFRAYSSLADGARRWLDHHRGIAGHSAGFLTALNAGDIPVVAHQLKLARYYSGSEPDYARGMARGKMEVDRAMGAK